MRSIGVALFFMLLLSGCSLVSSTGAPAPLPTQAALSAQCQADIKAGTASSKSAACLAEWTIQTACNAAAIGSIAEPVLDATLAPASPIAVAGFNAATALNVSACTVGGYIKTPTAS